ncbi:MAG: NAD(P)/FAD-dependent oxidoreductase [Lachnospiraceae bacterium]|nr:NAD(P)/FAD-dependent oxidoreductase [Lachnospiraceae bacterium]
MKKVIIIGAGPAGITAGYELLKRSKEYQVTILEESSEIGGISRTVRYNGNRMDIGGHRFFSKDEAVMDWWKALMPLQGAPAYDDKKLDRRMKIEKNGPDPEIEDRVLLRRNRISRIYYKNKFFDYPVKMNLNTIRNMGVLTTVNAGFSYLASMIHKREENSLENFYINRFGKKLYAMFFEGYTEKLWGRHPKDISADWGAQRVKGLSVSAILHNILQKALPGKTDNPQDVETSLIEEFYYPKYGPGQLWETAASEFQKMGGTIRFLCRVEMVTAGEHGIERVGYRQNGGNMVTEQADIFISSMPLKDLFLSMNHVPKQIRTIAEGLPYRDFVTVGLKLRKLNLRNETKLKTLHDIVPDCWIYVQDTGVKLGRIQIFNNWSPYLVEHPEEFVWIGLEYFCTEGDSWWEFSEREWIDFAVDELLRMGVIESRNDVLDGHRERVKKAYPAYFDTYAQMDELIQYLDRYQNLFCVGRNGQHRYNNMDHSMATSFEAVKNILNGKTDKRNIWNVNTEQVYHEEKES